MEGEKDDLSVSVVEAGALPKMNFGKGVVVVGLLEAPPLPPKTKLVDTAVGDVEEGVEKKLKVGGAGAVVF